MAQAEAQKGPAPGGAPGPSPQLSLAFRIGLFVAFLVTNGMVLMAQPAERATNRMKKIEFLGTACFVWLAATCVDSFLADFGARDWVRPLKAALFLPCYGLLVLICAPYTDDVMGPHDYRNASAEGVLIRLTVELMLNGVLAEFARWFGTFLVGDVQGGCSLLASTAGFVLPVILYTQQPNLRLRIEYLSAFLAAK
jgi:hypothetical protein